MSKVLYEFKGFDAGKMCIEEGVVGPTNHKTLCMKGLFIQGDVRNHNQRIYPSREIAKAVELLNKRINIEGSVQGQLDHPEELQINLDRVSHIITEIWMEGANGYGKLKLLPTPTGNIAKVLLESGVKLGVSSRGSGNVDDNGYVSDFEIVTVDIVSQPSAPDAYPRAIYESIYNMKGGPRLIEDARYMHVENKHYQDLLTKETLNFVKNLHI